MEPIFEALQLLKRQTEIQSGMRRFGGTRVTEERELFLIRNRLAQFPATVQAITFAATELRCPVDALSVRDVEKRCRSKRPRVQSRAQDDPNAESRWHGPVKSLPLAARPAWYRWQPIASQAP